MRQLNYPASVILLICGLASFLAKAQNVAINTIGNLPYASAILDLSNQGTAGSTGFLPPYVNLSGALNTFQLTAPAENGMLVWNNAGVNPADLYYWNGTTWVGISGAATAWQILGNTGITPSVAAIGTPITANSNFLGTKTQQDLVFALYNGANIFERMRIQASTGNIGIDVAPTASQMLTVAGNAASVNAIVGTTAQPTGYGVQGMNIAGSGTTAGVFGSSTSVSGLGVQGINNVANGVGIQGSNSATTGTSTGVEGYIGALNAPVNPSGVYGSANANTSYGILGVNNTSNGTGGFGLNPTATGTGLTGSVIPAASMVNENYIPTLSTYGIGVVGYGNVAGAFGTYYLTGGTGIFGAGFGATTPANIYTSAYDYGVFGDYGGTTNGSGVMGAAGTAPTFAANSGVMGSSSLGTAYGVLAYNSLGLANPGLLVSGTSILNGNTSIGQPNGVATPLAAHTGILFFYNSSNANNVNISAGVTTTSYPLLLPVATGTANQVLALLNAGTGQLGWSGGAGGVLGVCGTATTNMIPIYTNATTVCNSIINQNNAGTEIGIGLPVTNTEQEGLSIQNGLNIDQAGTDAGTMAGNPDQALTFGPNSGEGIGSNRVGGGTLRGLDFYTAYNERMTILNGGNVGVGTLTPQENLSVQKGLNIDEADLDVGTLTGNPDQGLTFGSNSGEGIGSNRLVGGGTYHGLDFYTQYIERMTILQFGEVGIGTTTPSAELETWASGQYTFTENNVNGIQTSTGHTNTTDYTLYMGADKTNHVSYIQSVQWGVATAPLILNGRGGNVGIDCASPIYTLDVNGNIRASGSVYYGGTACSTVGTVYTKPDYVYEPNYKKSYTPNEVEKFITEQGHLPWVTSAADEKKENNGAVDITRMSFQTLEAVENTQMQIIEQQKTIVKQQTLSVSQQAQIDQLKKQVADLANQLEQVLNGKK